MPSMPSMRTSISTMSGWCARAFSIGVLAVARFGDDGEVGLDFERRAQPHPHHLVVVDDHQPRLHASPPNGTDTLMRVPSPGSLRTSSVPPTSSTRCRRLPMPKPDAAARLAFAHADAVVGDRQRDAVRLERQRDLDVRRARVAEDVAESLLHDAVERGARRDRQRQRLAGDRQLDGQVRDGLELFHLPLDRADEAFVAARAAAAGRRCTAALPRARSSRAPSGPAGVAAAPAGRCRRGRLPSPGSASA